MKYVVNRWECSSLLFFHPENVKTVGSATYQKWGKKKHATKIFLSLFIAYIRLSNWKIFCLMCKVEGLNYIFKEKNKIKYFLYKSGTPWSWNSINGRVPFDKILVNFGKFLFWKNHCSTYHPFAVPKIEQTIFWNLLWVINGTIFFHWKNCGRLMKKHFHNCSLSGNFMF